MGLHVIDEAKRCLNCKKPRCQEGCPIHTPIPVMIQMLLQGEMPEAAEMVFANNPLSVICSLVCDHEKQCEGHCVKGIKGEPVHISSIENYISDTCFDRMKLERLPKNGKRIFLERIGVLWKHLNFTQKSTVRNLVRYKKRFFMTVIGIGGCMGLILVGFGLQDSITAIAKNQFVSLFTYQANAVLNSDVDESEKEALQTDLENYSGIDELLEMYCQNIELQTDKKTVDAVLEVPKELTNFNDFYAFRDRKSGEVYEFPTDGGAAISEKTATMLGVKAGDTVQLKKGDDIVDVKISIIVENYVRHYLYLAPDLYEELFGGAPDYNQLLMKYQDTSGNYETALGEKIMTYDGVAAISFTSDLIDQIDNMLRSLDIVIVVLIVSAGLLAFVVLYNLNNINITQRQRELATLKVLGFFDGEVASYVYRENMVLTLFGVIAGMGIGTFLHHCVIQTVEVDMMMFGRNVFPRSYGWSALITLAFALFVNFMMFYRLRKIDMIESLKSVE